ncbi:MAG: uxuA [Rhizobium sp.]|nr:uxuA [Rhizobium sp.]
MKASWRWFGPDDSVPLSHAMQAGASGIVTSLHHVPPGEVWTAEEVLRRRGEIRRSGLEWNVIESIPVHEDIKTRSGKWRTHIANYKDSLKSVAAAGLDTVCYNFMAITDWTRTDLDYRMPHGGTALRFDVIDFAAYDLFILERNGAEDDYSPEIVARARKRHDDMPEATRAQLESNLIGWVPARDFTFDRTSFREFLKIYDDVAHDDLVANLNNFLAEIIPVAADLGVRMCMHPDDPPFSLFGLPRVMSTPADYRRIFDFIDVPENGMTLCTGSLGSRIDNDLVEIAATFADRIHFAHLRDVVIEPDGSFVEAEHLEGRTNMTRVVRILLSEEQRRRAEGRVDAEIPFRSDHGHRIIDDIDKKVNPGYSCIGRLKGLAELRGVIRAVSEEKAMARD